MIASSFFDPVLGVDVHFEMVPTPAPVPTPIPNPFVGIVFDPVGLACGIALGAAIGAVTGAPFQGPVLYWTAFPATNTGTEAKHVPGHILIPPGVSWAPFPKTPKPVIHPGETPKPALPVVPENDAVVILGSKTVSVMGSNAVRLGDIALSCSEPLRLPSSVVLAVPKGPPILIGGPPSLDLMAAVMASLRTRFVSDSLHALLSRLKPSRFRNLLHRAVCFVTGHPVDVASGKVVTSCVDAKLPGPLPLTIERHYSSAFAGRAGPLGHGWSSSLDQSVWRERGKVVVLAEDGREIEFDTFDLPDHTIAPGQVVENRIDRLTLRCEAGGAWSLRDHLGVTRTFAPVPGRTDGRVMIQSMRSRCGCHEIQFHYGEDGRLAWVRDSVGRLIGLTWDPAGRLAELHLPKPLGEGFYRHRRYAYDEAGDLVQVDDALGHHWRFAYVTHLLTQECDRNGYRFFFAYDGLGEDAWCVRTWGQDGSLDHTLAYDKQNKVTCVTDSLGHTTIYRMNRVGQVVELVDPLGNTTRYEYDPNTLQRTAIVDPDGAITRYQYDARGNRIGYVAPDGCEARYTYGEHGPVAAVDPGGFEWRWTYDTLGRVRGCELPTGERTHYEYIDGLPNRVMLPGGATAGFKYDAHANLVATTDALGHVQDNRFDQLGRRVVARLPTGMTEGYHFDLEGRLRVVENPVGPAQRFEYDAEGNLLRVDNGRGRTDFEYGPLHRLHAKIVAGERSEYEYDSELRLIAVQNALGERLELERDARGLVIRERGFDGSEIRYRHDSNGRVIERRLASGRTSALSYDLRGRLLEVRHDDGEFERYEYRGDDQLLAAINQDAELRFVRDPMGRVLEERTSLSDGEEHVVYSRYRGDGKRIEVEGEGLVQRIERDVLGRVSAIMTGDGSWRASFTRDAMGLELDREFSSGACSRWQRDGLGRPQERWLRGADFQHRQRFTWVDDERLQAIEDSALGTTRYTYDGHGRPMYAELDGSWNLRVLDGAANPHERADGRDRRYLAGGRIAEMSSARFEYDADGRLIQIERAGQVQHLRWSSAGSLAAVSLDGERELRFVYDALGRRLAKRLVTRTGQDWTTLESRNFVWDGNKLLSERDGRGRVEHWIFEPESFNPLARFGPEGSLSAFVDQAGCPTEWVDDRGRLAVQTRLDLYGRERVLLDRDDRPAWSWPGQYQDRETGLSYNRSRYYAPEVGTYISADPLGLLGGLHPRAYVPDPLFDVDPFGLEGYRRWQIHSPGYDDVVQKGLHFYGPHGIELSVRPTHTGGITFTNAIPGDASHPRLGAAINEALEHFERNASFRADILEKARGGITSVLEHARNQSSDSLRALANGRSREMRDIVRNLERPEGGGGCGK